MIDRVRRPRLLQCESGGLPYLVESPADSRWGGHNLPTDLRTALTANPTALAAWEDITPLARNEFIC